MLNDWLVFWRSSHQQPSMQKVVFSNEDKHTMIDWMIVIDTLQQRMGLEKTIFNPMDKVRSTLPFFFIRAHPDFWNSIRCSVYAISNVMPEERLNHRTTKSGRTKRMVFFRFTPHHGKKNSRKEY